MAKNLSRARIESVSAEDLQRIDGVLRGIGGEHVNWGSVDLLNVWVAETRMEADRQEGRRILTATWVLAGATVALVAATIGLIVASLTSGA